MEFQLLSYEQEEELYPLIGGQQEQDQYFGDGVIKKNVKYKEARWGHNYNVEVLGGAWSWKQGRVQVDQGHEIRV